MFAHYMQDSIESVRYLMSLFLLGMKLSQFLLLSLEC